MLVEWFSILTVTLNCRTMFLNTSIWGPLSQIQFHVVQNKTYLRIIREDCTHGHQQMVNTKIRLIIFFAAKDEEALYSQGADCGSDHELLIAKFRLKLKKIGKTARPFR